MDDVFITDIQIKKVRHLRNIDIPLSKTKRKNLILTGKNGSGKTSVLETIRDYLQEYCRQVLRHDGTIKFDGTYRFDGSKVNPNPPVEKMEIQCNTDITALHDKLFFYFPASHKLQVDMPDSIEKITPYSSKDLVKYMVSYDYVGLSAEREGNTALAQQVKDWFSDFENKLRIIFECPTLEVRKYGNFDGFHLKIKLPDRDLFGFNELADGFASILEIVTEIILYTARTEGASFDSPGIVLIDEIETHLHISLQKEVLRFLTTMFPNIQFIVTTHSPFVISSVENAVVYDLERQIGLEDLTAYSYDGIVEYYYNTDKYSQKIKSDFGIYKSLIEKAERTEKENLELAGIITYLRNIPSAAAPELINSFRSLELKRKSSNGKN